jgi:hypothetical protein
MNHRYNFKSIFTRDASESGTVLAGYPTGRIQANSKAGYRISGKAEYRISSRIFGFTIILLVKYKIKLQTSFKITVLSKH